MKKLLYILLSAILAAATACHPRSAASLGDFDISLYAPAYSSGFEIFGAEGMKSTILKTYAPWQGAEGEETQLFIARNGEQAPADFPGQVLDGDARRIVCMSSTYIAMLDALGEPQRVVGVSGIDYISNPYVASHKEQIGDVGYDGNMNYERLLSLSPDIVLLFGVSGASAMEPKLRELGIPYAYMGEYLEQSPLGKAEWLVAVAEIAGMRERGEEVFREIPLRYDSLKTLAAKAERKPVVMLNTPYGDSWLMAPPSSYVPADRRRRRTIRLYPGHGQSVAPHRHGGGIPAGRNVRLLDQRRLRRIAQGTSGDRPQIHGYAPRAGREGL